MFQINRPNQGMPPQLVSNAHTTQGAAHKVSSLNRTHKVYSYDWHPTFTERHKLRERKMVANNASRQLRPASSQRFVYPSHCPWHVRTLQIFTSQWDQRMVQYSAQTKGDQPCPLLKWWAFWRVQKCSYILATQIYIFFILDWSSVRSVAATWKSSLHKKSGKWTEREETAEIMSKNKVTVKQPQLII